MDGANRPCANADARSASSFNGSARSNRVDRVPAPVRNTPPRSDSGPLTTRLPSDQVSSRAIAGGRSLDDPAPSGGTAALSAIDPPQVFAGRRGVSTIARPGASTSIGISPVITSARSQASTRGNSSGVPVPIGSVTSAWPMRIIVCVHELPRAPIRAGSPVLRPPLSTRSPITSGISAPASPTRSPVDGSMASGSTVMTLPSGGRSDVGACPCTTTAETTIAVIKAR